MYSERFNTIFVHIPKTAGQSIETLFLDQLGLSWSERSALLMGTNAEPGCGPQRLAHLYAREYVEFGHVAASAFADAFRFAVVRNPFDRFASLYVYRAKKWRASFEELAASLSPGMEDTSEAGRMLAPQTNFVLGRDGAMLVDAVLRFENLEEDFRSVSQRLFGEAVRIPHRNRAKRSRERPHIGQDAARYIFRHYEADFDLFRYPSRA